jgi:hypothetical protein
MSNTYTIQDMQLLNIYYLTVTFTLISIVAVFVIHQYYVNKKINECLLKEAKLREFKFNEAVCLFKNKSDEIYNEIKLKHDISCKRSDDIYNDLYDILKVMNEDVKFKYDINCKQIEDIYNELYQNIKVMKDEIKELCVEMQNIKENKFSIKQLYDQLTQIENKFQMKLDKEMIECVDFMQQIQNANLNLKNQNEEIMQCINQMSSDKDSHIEQHTQTDIINQYKLGDTEQGENLNIANDIPIQLQHPDDIPQVVVKPKPRGRRPKKVKSLRNLHILNLNP